MTQESPGGGYHGGNFASEGDAPPVTVSGYDRDKLSFTRFEFANTVTGQSQTSAEAMSRRIPLNTEYVDRELLWAEWRFSIIGHLLDNPPSKAELVRCCSRLADLKWQHPYNDGSKSVGVQTLLKWHSMAKHAPDPIRALRTRASSDKDNRPAVAKAVAEWLRRQRAEHPDRSLKAIYRNLETHSQKHPEFNPIPTYQNVRFYLLQAGLHRPRQTPVKPVENPAPAQPIPIEFSADLPDIETRSVNELWLADFYQGNFYLRDDAEKRGKPYLLAFLDDRSRYVCYAGWYPELTPAAVFHGLSQAIHHAGLPRSFMAGDLDVFRAAEITSGLRRLDIQDQGILPFWPTKEHIIRRFWFRVKTRLEKLILALEPRDRSLERIKQITQRWVHRTYHRRRHDEISATPCNRFKNDPQAGRVPPQDPDLKEAFRQTAVRRVNRKDGTVTIQKIRFKIPERYRRLSSVKVNFAYWDLSRVDLVRPDKALTLCREDPLDEAADVVTSRNVSTGLPFGDTLEPEGLPLFAAQPRPAPPDGRIQP